MARGDSWLVQNSHDAFDGDPVDIRPAAGVTVMIVSVLVPNTNNYFMYFSIPNPSDAATSPSNNFTDFALNQADVSSTSPYPRGPGFGIGSINCKIIITNSVYLRIAANGADANRRWDYHVSGIVMKQ